MKVTKYIAMATVLAFGSITGSCTDGFDELNINSHGILEEGFSDPHANISSVILYSSNMNYTQENNALAGGAHLYERIKILGQDGYAQFTTNGLTPNDSYNSDYFGSHYISHIKVLNQALDVAHLYSDEANLKGYGLTWRTFLQARFTDHFGPTPYPLTAGDVTAKYMSLEEQYNQYFADLETAISSFDSSLATLKREHVYQGDVDKWKRFANSIRLSLALKISEVNPALCKEQVQKCFDSPVGFMEEGEDVLFKPYPLWGNNYPYAELSWTNITLTTSMEKILTNIGGQNLKKPEGVVNIGLAPTKIDPRATLMYQFSDAYTENETTVRSWQGINPQMANPGVFAQRVAKMNVKIHRSDASKYLKLMSYTEVCFHVAEALERQLGSTTGTAQDWYEKGVKASFKLYGIDTEAIAYLASSERNSWGTSAKYGDGTTLPGNTNLEKIITQKYIASYPEMSLQAWNDKRRLNLPAMDVAQVRPDGQANWPSMDIKNPLNFMQRSPFPAYEAGRNNERYTAGVNMLKEEAGTNDDGGDRVRTSLWWAARSNYITTSN